MSELAEFEEPGKGEVFRLVELNPMQELQGLVDLAFIGVDYEPIEKNQLEVIWGSRHGYSGSMRHKTSYDPVAQTGCAIAEMQSLLYADEISHGTDPHKPNDPGFLEVTPGATFSGHWLCVAWEETGINYLINMDNGVVYVGSDEGDDYSRVTDENLDYVNEDITRVLSMVIDDAL